MSDEVMIGVSKEQVNYFLNIPYNTRLTHLYTPDDMFNNYVIGKPETVFDCYDTLVYKHVCKTGFFAHNNSFESLARILHDGSITTLLYAELDKYEEAKTVGIMGGHSWSRDSDEYLQCTLLSKKLAESGYLVITGGGPGAMEAAHLGVYMAYKKEEDVYDAISILSEAPLFDHKLWVDCALRVKQKYKQKTDIMSISIPTWLYGHEPPNVFANYIAKYFDNSIREGNFLLECYGGLIVMPGSAGTFQELFQKICINHYEVTCVSSPIILFGKDFWKNQISFDKTLCKLISEGVCKKNLFDIVDNNDEALESLTDFTNIQKMIIAKNKKTRIHLVH